MSHATLLRPGSVLGAYPEREISRIGALEGVVSHVGATLHGLRRNASAGFVRVLPAIEREGERLAQFDDSQLDAECVVVRERLARDGLLEAGSVSAFALVREAAVRSLSMRPFDVQLRGGWVMLHGMLAEMQTGQGKTLTATLPACTAALAGIPVHVITANDYLARRDAQTLGPLYERLGLSVGVSVPGMTADERRAAYACDVTYCTGQQVAFDYLQDRLLRRDQGGRIAHAVGRLKRGANRAPSVLLRGLCVAIIDEADSILIDEARTPLVLSRQRDTSYEGDRYREALDIADALNRSHYSVSAAARSIEITDAGDARLQAVGEARGGAWAQPRRRRELVRKALTARHLFHRDEHYLVRDGKVQIIDPNSGRAMPDRSWEQGLHQLIETKEGCDSTAARETLARTTYQRLFRRYLRVGGMSGTLREVATELEITYGLRVVEIPPHRPVRRRSAGRQTHASARSQTAGIVTSVRARTATGQAVLIGTRTMAASERLSEMLTRAHVAHTVLNASQDVAEADIIARAGQRGAVTVATNMAGRGTDIQLGPGVEACGGLHVLVAELNDARRIDRQLIGRCARQGDQGSFEVILSLEDTLIARHGSRLLRAMLSHMRPGGGVVPTGLARWLVRDAQRAVEQRDAAARRALRKSDESRAQWLAFSRNVD